MAGQIERADLGGARVRGANVDSAAAVRDYRRTADRMPRPRVDVLNVCKGVGSGPSDEPLDVPSKRYAQAVDQRLTALTYRRRDMGLVALFPQRLVGVHAIASFDLNGYSLR